MLPYKVTELISWFYFTCSSQSSFYSSSQVPYFILCVLLSNPHPPSFLLLSHWMGAHSSPISKLTGLTRTCTFFFFLHLHLLTHDPALSLTLCKNPLLPLGSGSIPFLLNRLFHFLFSYLSLTLSVTLSPVIHFCLALKLVLESSREETKFSTLPSSDLPVSLTSIFSLLVHFSIHLSVTLFLP